MCMSGEFRQPERMRLFPRNLSDDETATLMYGHTAAQVGHLECILAIAAIGCSDQVEKHVVLADLQQPAIAESPAVRGEGTGKHPNLTTNKVVP